MIEILSIKKTVQKTIDEWISEEGSLMRVSRRMGMHHSAISKAYNGQIKMTASRWEKWKILWQISNSHEELDCDFDNTIQYAKILAKNELKLMEINRELKKIGYKIVITKKDAEQ